MEPQSIEELKEAVAQAPTDHARIEALLALADAMILTHNDESLAYSSEALTIAESLGDEQSMALALLKVGLSEFYKGNYAKSRTQIERARDLFLRLNDTRRASRATGNLGNISLNLGDIPAAIALYREALSFAESEGDRQMIARWSGNLGIACENTGDFEEALRQYRKALAIFQEGSDQVGIAEFTGSIGRIHSSRGEYLEALRALQSAVELTIPTGEDRMIASWLGQLGVLYTNLKKFDLAQNAYQDALERSRRVGDKEATSRIAAHLGSLYLTIGNYQNALAILEEARDLAEAVGNRNPQAEIHYYLGCTHTSLHNFHAAIADHRRAIALAEQTGSRLIVAVSKNNIGKIFADQETEFYNPAEAERMLLESEAMLRAVGAKPELMEALRSHAELYQKQNRWEEACHYLNEHFALKEDILSQDALRRVRDIEHHHQLTEAENEKKLIEMKAQHLEEQLANSAIHLAAQAEMLSNFQWELRKIVREIDEPINALKKIKEKLKELPCESVDWLKFENEFTAVHPEFRAKIIDKFPALTKQEVKMCQLARLGLKTHEMAQLLCLSDRTVDGHRNSLRKKLGLSPSENLGKFLRTL